MDNLTRIVTYCFISFVFVAPSQLIFASHVRINWPEMVNSVRIFEDSVDTPIDSVLLYEDSVFCDYKGELLNKNTKYWIRIVIDNSKAEEQSYFIQFLIYASKIKLYQLDKEFRYIEKTGGYLVPVKQRSNGGISPGKMPFVISGEKQTVLYLKYYIELENNFRFDKMKIISSEKIVKHNEDIFILQIFFAGIILILLILNFTLFSLLKDRLYLYYALYILFNWIYFLRYAQLSERFVFYNLPAVNISLYFSLLFAQAAYVWFLYELIKREQVGKWKSFMRIYRYPVTVFALIIFVFSLLGLRRAVGFNNMYSIVNALLAMVLFVALYAKASKILKIILVGTVLLASTGFISHIAEFMGIYSLVVSTYQVGFFIEMVLFTIAINHFYYNEKLEKKQVLLINSQIDSLIKEQENTNRILAKRLEENNRDIAAKAFIITQKDQLIKNVAENLKEIKNCDTNLTLEIQRILNSLKVEQKSDSWEEFEMCLKRIHPRFYSELACLYPGLSKNDIKLCALIKLNLSTKQIASVTGKTINSIDVSRSRLCKKLGVKSNELITIINTIGNYYVNAKA